MAESHKIQQRVESLCQSGCKAVNATIAALESGQPVAQVEDLSAEERNAVLRELKTIMAVYDGDCEA